MSDSPPSAFSVGLLAPSGNDARIACEVLEKSGIAVRPCQDVAALCELIEAQCGAVLIADEALNQSAVDAITSSLEKQPPWSDLPILLLSKTNLLRMTEVFSRSANVSLLERPFAQVTLVRAVEVTLRARAKQYEVSQLLSRLEVARDESEKANRSKSEFLANMSHEIRTPIGAIMGFIHLALNSGRLTSEDADYLGIAQRNSKQLLAIIDDILDLSKVEAGQLEIEKIQFDLVEILRDVLHSKDLTASAKGISLNIEFKTPIPQYVTSDPTRIRQILLNLITNAIKFTDRGGVTIEMSRKASTLTFDVIDTGIGMNSDEASKLFRPFTQADSSTTRRFGGTGLGLSLSRQLAALLEGELYLAGSVPDQGSHFTFTCPVCIEPATPEVTSLKAVKTVQPQVEELTEGPSLSSLRILLVEDSKDNQLLVSLYLKPTKCRLDFASNGREGLNLALAHSYDLVLMDIQMPEMDGHEAVRALRERGFNRPVVALTAHAMLEERKRAEASGFDDYLTKPIDRNALLNMVERYAKPT